MKFSSLLNINIKDIIPTLTKSRTVQTAVLDLILAIGICLVPELEPYRIELLQLLGALGVGTVFRFGGEDIAIAWKTGQRSDKYQAQPYDTTNDKA